MKNFILIFLLSFFIFGCSSTSTYQGKYNSVKLDTRMFNVSFEGKNNMDINEAENFALLRAAEVTIQNGYSYFNIINTNSTLNEESNVRFNSINHNNIWWNNGFHRHHNFFNTVVVYHDANLIKKPYIRHTITLHNKNNKDSTLYNAASIIKNLNDYLKKNEK